MIKNVGFGDKILRISLAIALIVLGALLDEWWLMLIAVLPFLTAFIGFCPLYVPLKINTNREREKTGTKMVNKTITSVAKKSKKKVKTNRNK